MTLVRFGKHVHHYSRERLRKTAGHHREAGFFYGRSVMWEADGAVSRCEGTLVGWMTSNDPNGARVVYVADVTTPPDRPYSMASVNRIRRRPNGPTRRTGMAPFSICRYTVRELMCQYFASSETVMNWPPLRPMSGIMAMTSSDRVSVGVVDLEWAGRTVEGTHADVSQREIPGGRGSVGAKRHGCRRWRPHVRSPVDREAR